MLHIRPRASSPPPTIREDIPQDVRSVGAGVEAGLTENQEEKPQMSVPITIALLVAITVVCR